MVTLKKIAQYVSFAAASLALAGGTAHAATIIGAVEDGFGVSSTEGVGDFNDMIFSITGNVGLIGNGTLSALTSSIVNENGSPFWDNRSLDGAVSNVGYCLLRNGLCTINPDPGFTNLQYFSNGGGAVNSVSFSYGGGGESVNLLLENTLQANINVLGYYLLSNPTNLIQLFPGIAGAPANVTFTPTGDFGLYFTTTVGTTSVTYNSQANLNLIESPTQQHFAFFSSGTPPTITPGGGGGAVPEPATMGVMATLLAFGVAGKMWNARKSQAEKN